MAEDKLPDGTGLPTPTSAPEVKKDAEPDYEVILREKDAKIAKLAQDRDNYRAGMLKYKNLKPEDKEPLEEERIKQIVQETLINSDLARAQSEKDELIARIARENKEMKVAMANKSQISNMPSGSGQPEFELKPEQITEQQKADLTEAAKQAGISPDKFIDSFLENLKKPK